MKGIYAIISALFIASVSAERLMAPYHPNGGPFQRQHRGPYGYRQHRGPRRHRVGPQRHYHLSPAVMARDLELTPNSADAAELDKRLIPLLIGGATVIPYIAPYIKSGIDKLRGKNRGKRDETSAGTTDSDEHALTFTHPDGTVTQLDKRIIPLLIGGATLAPYVAPYIMNGIDKLRGKNPGKRALPAAPGTIDLASLKTEDVVLISDPSQLQARDVAGAEEAVSEEAYGEEAEGEDAGYEEADTEDFAELYGSGDSAESSTTEGNLVARSWQA